ncbi:transcription factor, fungi [Aspergillus terreus]|uniref:Transcription factor, fungi n=1 Tax=Aspergillus terreus TaxID=33178 RepID=A0A5M3YW46_ASPTE|nr:hypothetical protein ATETN484_0004034700 [Aspergillus terreus]GFF13237.1 transcription factor, fungi [Aspergillus terreus]
MRIALPRLPLPLSCNSSPFKPIQATVTHHLPLADGRTLAFTEYGSPTGHPLLYFHGYPSSGREASAIHALAQGHNLRIISPDRPGFGQSTFQPSRRIADWPADVSALTRHLGIPRFAVLGCSGGGPYAVACAHALPNVLSAVGVFAGGGPWSAGTRDIGFTRRLTAWASVRWPRVLGVVFDVVVGGMWWVARTRVVSRMIENWLEKSAVDVEEKTVPVSERRVQLLEMVFGGFAQGTAAAVQEARLLSQDWGVRCEEVKYDRILIWHGTRDVNSPIRLTRWMAERLPHAVLREWDENHYTMGHRIDEALGELVEEIRSKEVLDDLENAHPHGNWEDFYLALGKFLDTPSEYHIDRTPTTAKKQDRSERSEAAHTNTQGTELGQLYIARGAPSFFGNSYFGHQVAARMIHESAPDLPPMSLLSSKDSFQSFRNDSGPFSQVWDLLGLLPRSKITVDRLIERFLTEVNWAVDTVHAETFRAQFAEFWGRKFGFDEIAGVDLRWLALLFIILAFSVLLERPATPSPEKRRESEEASLRFYWAARRAIVISPSFHGESLDLVRAGLMVTRYLLYTRQVAESWLTISFAMRMAQAQGMHVDGEKWGLSPKATETRRRLWANLYMLDKTIALALGRPYAISDHMCLIQAPENIWLDNVPDEQSAMVTSNPLSDPTPSAITLIGHGLAKIAGEIQDRCFGLYPAAYDVVVEMDEKLVAWKEQLPAYFALDSADTSLDSSRAFLPWHRLSLHSAFHFARITLHRPYLLRESITNRFRLSHEACISSASSDLKMRLRALTYGTAENMRWTLGTHNMFNSALILGIIAVRRPNAAQTAGILEDLDEYCEKLRKDPWLNEFGLAEVKVVELCVARTRGFSRGSGDVHRQDEQSPSVGAVPVSEVQGSGPSSAPVLSAIDPSMDISAVDAPTHPPESSPDMMWPAIWEDQNFAFPDAADLETWEHMISEIAYHM